MLRGAGFAFRKEMSRLPLQRAAGATFAFSSLVTPFFMGTVIGAIATGAVPANASHASLAAWTSPTALLAGFLFVAACGYLAAVYLVGEAARRGDRRMQAYFTRRAQAAAIVAGALSLAALAALHGSNPALYDRLTGRALPLVVLAGVCGLAVLALLTAGRLSGDPGHRRARRGRGRLGMGRGPVPGAAARHRGDPEQRRRPARHPGRARRLVRRRRAGHRALLRSCCSALQGRRLLDADEAEAIPAVTSAGQTQPPAAPWGQPPADQNPVIRAIVLALLVLVTFFRRLRHR